MAKAHMSEQRHQGPALLLFSFDDVDTDKEIQIGTCAPSDVTEKEIEKSQNEATMEGLSDVANKYKRIPFPIDGSIFKVYYQNSQGQQSKRIDYTLGEYPTLLNERDSVSISFETRTNAHGLFNAVALDILQSIAGIHMRFKDIKPRVTFISGGLCIFDAYWTGINRTQPKGTELETLTIHLERSFKDVEEKKAETKSEDDEIIHNDVSGDSASRAEFEAHAKQTGYQSINDWVGITHTTNSAYLPNGFNWYEIDTLYRIHTTPTSVWEHERLVNRKPVQIRTAQVPYEGKMYADTILVYDNRILSLNNFPKIIENYCVTEYGGVVYLGISKFNRITQPFNYLRELRKSYQHVLAIRHEKQLSPRAQAVRAKRVRGVV